MSSSRRPILFACTQSTGLLNPSLVLAGELARRGVDDLWFATDDNRREEVEAVSSASPVRFVSMGEVDPRYAPTMWDEETYRAVTQPSRFGAYLARVKRSMDAEFHYDRYRRMDAAVADIEPALMVINNLCVYAIQVAMTRNIPFVITAPFPPSALFEDSLPLRYPTPVSGLPRDMTLPQQVANLLFRLRLRTLVLRPSILRRGIEYDKAMTALGVDRRSHRERERLAAAELILCFSLFGLDYPFPVPDKLHTLGAMIPPLPEAPGDDAVSRWLDAHESVVYVAFGTITRLTQREVDAMIDVARRLEGRHHVLWKLPREQQNMLPPAERLPGNLRVESWLPSQCDVLAHPHVRAFFNHGGSNSFHEGIYFGTPLLVRPLWLDCYDHAVRAVDSGVGLAVDRPETIDPEDVYGKLVRLLEEPSFRARAEQFGQRQRATGGVRAAADLILGCPAFTATADASPVG